MKRDQQHRARDITDDELIAAGRVLSMGPRLAPDDGGGGGGILGGDEYPSMSPNTWSDAELLPEDRKLMDPTDMKEPHVQPAPGSLGAVANLLAQPLPTQAQQADNELQLIEVMAQANRSPSALPLFERAQEILAAHYPNVSWIVVGNLAVEAEACKLNEIADSIHHLQMDEGVFSDFRQASQYISFLIDEMPDRIGEAKELLDSFSLAELPADLQSRYLRLQGQLLAEHPRYGDVAEAQDGLEAAFAAVPSSNNAVALLLVYDAVEASVEQVLAVVDRFEAAHPDDETECARVRRGAGDVLATQRNSRNARDTARRLYYSLKGTARWEPDAWHNLATLLYHDDVDTDEATRLWTQAYRDKPSDLSIRRAFAQLLSREGEPELASRVLVGQDLPDDWPPTEGDAHLPSLESESELAIPPELRRILPEMPPGSLPESDSDDGNGGDA